MIKSNSKEFIKKSKSIHGNEYDYSKVNYINNQTKVIIICKKHGEFNQTPNAHLNKQGCPKCKGGIRYNKETFIKKSKSIHGNEYDYSKVNYINSQTKVKIICPTHGIFEQTPNKHLMGQGCYKCGGTGISNKMNNEKIIEKSKKIHGNKYDYSFIDYKGNNKTKIKIICPIHGIFEQVVNYHLSGSGCPHCKESKGEKKIRKYLSNNNIYYVYQKTFKNCKHINKLYFDFYLPEKNICIEYDGEQHFNPIDYFGGEKNFREQKIKDNIKNKFCKDNNINLIRIKFNENINKILKSTIPYYFTNKKTIDQVIYRFWYILHTEEFIFVI